MTPDEEVRRGNDATAIVGNPIYQEAMVILRGEMMHQFQQTKFDQSDERDEIWRKMQIMDWFENQLQSIMATGKMGAGTMELQQSQETH